MEESARQPVQHSPLEPIGQVRHARVQFGSEPLYDDVLPHDQLAQQVLEAKQSLSYLGIPVTVSELAYGYQERGGAQDVLDAIDSINIHMLPFFAATATTGKSPLIQSER